MRARLPLALGLAIAAAACGGDGVVTVGPSPSPPGAPTLSSLQSSIFTPRCALSGCHAGPSPQQGMNLSAGLMFVNTVNVDSVELSGFKRIAPNNATDSYLYMKISGDPRIFFDRMPQNANPLSAAELESVRLWIEAGALDN